MPMNAASLEDCFWDLFGPDLSTFERLGPLVDRAISPLALATEPPEEPTGDEPPAPLPLHWLGFLPLPEAEPLLTPDHLDATAGLLLEPAASVVLYGARLQGTAQGQPGAWSLLSLVLRADGDDGVGYLYSRVLLGLRALPEEDLAAVVVLPESTVHWAAMLILLELSEAHLSTVPCVPVRLRLR